jgi:DNA-binding transcriptional regulator YdaS (Cro superfamily)
MPASATKDLTLSPLQMGCVFNNPVVDVSSMTHTPLHRAIAAQPFNGSQSAFARAIGTSQQNISNWLRANRPLPAEYVLKAEEVTGIARSDWRPDIYPLAELPTSEVA